MQLKVVLLGFCGMIYNQLRHKVRRKKQKKTTTTTKQSNLSHGNLIRVKHS